MKEAVTKACLGMAFAWSRSMREFPHRGERGQELIEFALIAPLLIWILFAVVSFGLLFSCQNTLNNAAREGARAGAVCKTDDEIRQIISANAASLSHASTIVVSITALDNDGVALPPGQRQRGGVISITLNYLADVVPIPGILSGTKALTGKAAFRMECDSSAP
jgi:hypothetical protein